MLQSRALSSKPNPQPLLVDVGRVPASVRGELLWYVDARIEEALGVVGALPRPTHVDHSAKELLADQLYRARLMGHAGLELSFGSLSPIQEDGSLDSQDEMAWQCWNDAVRFSPVTLSIAPSRAIKPSSKQNETKTKPSKSFFTTGSFFEEDDEPDPEECSLDAPYEPDETPIEHDATLDEPDGALVQPANLAVSEEMLVGAKQTPQSDAETSVNSEEVPIYSQSIENTAEPPVCSEEFVTAPKELLRSSEKVVENFVKAERGESSATCPAPSARSDVQQRHANALEQLQGAFTWSKLTSLFCEHYLPLQKQLLLSPGERNADTGADALELFKNNFSESFKQVASKLSGRTRRPQMVLDAPRLTYQLGRKHAAKQTKLILADAMRYDIGQLASAKLKLQLLGTASCVDQGVLWAALPTTTAAQLELLAKGPDGLQNIEGSLDERQLVSSSDARRFRGLRAGPHSLYKLDAIENSLVAGCALPIERLDALAAEVAVSAARFIKQQPVGTLVVLFGDHGFRLEDSSSGGASPDEVLVPYHAWFVGSSAPQPIIE